MLHINNFVQQQRPSTIESSTNRGMVEETPASTSISAHVFTSGEQVLLATVVVLAVGPNAKTVACRALLDSGSQRNFITEEMVQALNLKKDKARHVVTGIGEITQHASASVWLKIRSHISDYTVYLPLIVVPKITGQLPTQNIKAIDNIPEYIELADPHFNTPQKID